MDSVMFTVTRALLNDRKRATNGIFSDTKLRDSIGVCRLRGALHGPPTQRGSRERLHVLDIGDGSRESVAVALAAPYGSVKIASRRCSMIAKKSTPGR